VRERTIFFLPHYSSLSVSLSRSLSRASSLTLHLFFFLEASSPRRFPRSRPPSLFFFHPSQRFVNNVRTLYLKLDLSLDLFSERAKQGRRRSNRSPSPFFLKPLLFNLLSPSSLPPSPSQLENEVPLRHPHRRPLQVHALLRPPQGVRALRQRDDGRARREGARGARRVQAVSFFFFFELSQLSMVLRGVDLDFFQSLVPRFLPDSDWMPFARAFSCGLQAKRGRGNGRKREKSRRFTFFFPSFFRSTRGKKKKKTKPQTSNLSLKPLLSSSSSSSFTHSQARTTKTPPTMTRRIDTGAFCFLER